VDGVVRDLEQERLRAVRFDEGDGAIREVFRGALGRGATGSGGLRVALGFVRDLPTLLRGTETGAAEVPFAEVAGFVADRTETFGEGLDLERQLQRHDRIGEARVGTPVAGDVLRDAKARLVLAALNIRARGRADGAGVELSEAQALLRETVEVRRLVEGVAVAPEVGPPKIVGENEDDIRRRRFRFRRECARCRRRAGDGEHEREERETPFHREVTSADGHRRCADGDA
jgi:hypothetical protein